MAERKAKIKVESENIFPIIKKWLYSDHDIFARELVSNACDAVTKLKKLAAAGEADAVKDGDFAVRVGVSSKNKTLTFSDNGVGMTADELDKYINEVAFSGAEEFLSKYKGDGAGIIGHFGLGFYSAFMVASRVTIDTLSYKKGSAPAKWECDGGVDVTISDGKRKERGTTVTLYAAGDADAAKFFNLVTLRQTLDKYCAYLPVKILLKDEDHDKSEAFEVNRVPLWTRAPKDCKPEDYKEFYRQMFLDFKEPLFWIHLNVDYPFNLKGILFFPDADLRNVRDEGSIKLFNNQVYVADNIKDVIPEYLLLLRGCLDCPDVPLNVSRSFLQNDGYVLKIKAHITKKVAEKLKELYEKDLESYKKYWKTVNPFVKYGCMLDKDFYEKIKDAVIFKTVSDEYVTLKEVLKEKTVVYADDKASMSLYLDHFKGKRVLLLDDLIDVHFIQFLETQNKDIKFARADSDAGAFKAGAAGGKDTADAKVIEEAFKRVIGGTVKIEAGPLKADAPCILILGERARRMETVGRMYGLGNDAVMRDEKLAVNTAHPYIKNLAKKTDDAAIKALYNLARLAGGALPAEEAAPLAKAVYKLLA